MFSDILYSRIGNEFPTTPAGAVEALDKLDANPLPRDQIAAASPEDRQWLSLMVEELFTLSKL